MKRSNCQKNSLEVCTLICNLCVPQFERWSTNGLKALYIHLYQNQSECKQYKKIAKQFLNCIWLTHVFYIFMLMWNHWFFHDSFSLNPVIFVLNHLSLNVNNLLYKHSKISHSTCVLQVDNIMDLMAMPTEIILIKKYQPSLKFHLGIFLPLLILT